MAKFEKGISGNLAGRPPGKKSRASEEIRNVLLNFLNNNIDSLQETYDKLDHKDKIRLLTLVFRYTMTLPFDPENLSIENLEQIIKYLKNGQQKENIIARN
jgi:hypothetical protein